MTATFLNIKKYVRIKNEDANISKFLLFVQMLIACIYVLINLILNYFYLIRLKIFKLRNKISQPIIHYYALCWNEEKILPFVFDYYKDIVSHFYIYDNYSTDNSVVLVERHDKTRVIYFKTDNSFNDLEHIKIKNNCWKHSRGKADYVIVCDMDEFLYHPDFCSFLNSSFHHKISYFIPEGFNMFANSFPEIIATKKVTDQIKIGIPDKDFNKPILFDPHRIVEINYTAGAHFAYPWGIVNMSKSKELKLLHYKNLGVEYVLQRVNAYRSRLSAINKEHNYGLQYLDEDEKIKKDFFDQLVMTKQVIS